MSGPGVGGRGRRGDAGPARDVDGTAARKQASRQASVGRARTSRLELDHIAPSRARTRRRKSAPECRVCGLWPAPRPPPRAAARLRACGFAAASPMLERCPGVQKGRRTSRRRVRVGCFLLGGRWLPCIQGKYVRISAEIVRAHMRCKSKNAMTACPK